VKVLGIESSCDETAVAVVEDGNRVLANLVRSQIERHRPFGGVVPEIAAREHLNVIHSLVDDALKQSSLLVNDIDAIAVSQGPGLIGALLVGVSYAKGLACSTAKPLIGVDHVHAHIHGGFLGGNTPLKEMFPCLALVVSGGHTNMYIMRHETDYQLVAHSLDDACGECFDKVAKLFGHPYPGGPVVEKLAKNGDPNSIFMPTMVEQKSRLAFSYSGLKTHMLQLFQKEKKPIPSARQSDIMASFQQAALGQLVRKISTATEIYEPARILIAGGVAANGSLRQMLEQRFPGKVIFPDLRFCSDNAAMIAACGYHHLAKFENTNFPQDYSWDAYSRYHFAPQQG